MLDVWQGSKYASETVTGTKKLEDYDVELYFQKITEAPDRKVFSCQHKSD